jgi:hypothetical protein
MNLRIGDRVPDKELKAHRRGDTSPRSVRLSDYRGRWVVLFGQGAEAPAYEELRRDFGDANAIVLGVCRDGDDRFAYPVVVDPADELGVAGATAVVDPAGEVQQVGAWRASDVLAVLRTLVYWGGGRSRTGTIALGAA